MKGRTIRAQVMKKTARAGRPRCFLESPAWADVGLGRFAAGDAKDDVVDDIGEHQRGAEEKMAKNQPCLMWRAVIGCWRGFAKRR